MKAGRLIGIIILILGVIANICLYTIFATSEYIPRVVVSGPALIIVGLAMIIFPGGNVTNQELKNKTKTMGIMWKNAPLLHKLMWIFALILGAVASLFQMISIGFI